jgi:hypothetical protein
MFRTIRKPKISFDKFLLGSLHNRVAVKVPFFAVRRFSPSYVLQCDFNVIKHGGGQHICILYVLQTYVTWSPAQNWCVTVSL